MSFTDKLLVTIIAGLILWIIKGLVVYFVKKDRVRAAINNEVGFILGSVKDIKAYLEDSFDATVKAGKEVEYTAHYTIEEPGIYRAYISLLTSYFSKKELIQITKFYRAAREFDVLCSGLFSDLDEWKKVKYKLTTEDIQYLGRKKARILSIANIFTEKQISDISDLPNDYRGQLDAGTIVR